MNKDQEVYGSIKIFIFLYAALHTIYISVYLKRLSCIHDQNLLIHISINIHEMILEFFKLLFVSTAASVLPYEFIIKDKNKMIYYLYVLLIVTDMIFTSCKYLLLGMFFFISNVLERNEEYERLKISEEEVGKHDICGICLEDYQKDDDVLQLICMHIFHQECLSKWLEMGKTCPACKKDLVLQICLYENRKLRI